MNVFNNVILARNRQLPDDDRTIEKCRIIFKSFNINNLSVCIGWCTDQVTLRSARCNNEDVVVYLLYYWVKCSCVLLYCVIHKKFFVIVLVVCLYSVVTCYVGRFTHRLTFWTGHNFPVSATLPTNWYQHFLPHTLQQFHVCVWNDVVSIRC